jgi:hypothetical protein
MKKLMNLLIIVLMSYTVIAQEETLLSGEMENGGYGGVFTKVGQINNATGVFIGGQGAWIINHRIGLGGKGYGLVNEVNVPDMQNVKLEFGCGGGLIEYIIASDKSVHANINVMIGAGGVKYAVIDYQNDHSEINYTDDSFFVIEPGVDLILNVHKNFRLGIGAAYRFVSGVDYEDLTNTDLSGTCFDV